MSGYSFKEYYNDSSPGAGTILIITLIWRIISYYLYLLLVPIVIPGWVNKSLGKKQKAWNQTPSKGFFKISDFFEILQLFLHINFLIINSLSC